MRKAYLYNKNGYTYFKVSNDIVKFYTSPYLEKYIKVKEYDNGYIVVDEQLSTTDEHMEDYIDLEYVFDELGLDKNILREIQEVIIL